MKLGYINVYVDDAVRATEFCERVFGMRTRFVHESNRYDEMNSGDTVLAFAQNEMLYANTGIYIRSGVKNCFGKP